MENGKGGAHSPGEPAARRTGTEARERPLNRPNPVQSYRETQIRTANPGRLIVMLYDGALRSIARASEALDRGVRGYDAANTAIIRAQDIVAELMASLDMERGGEMASNLFGLYAFVNRQLMDANLGKDRKPLETARSLLAELREAWNAIADTKTPSERRQGINIAG
jgi:flagellar secretion chaperone FliS